MCRFAILVVPSYADPADEFTSPFRSTRLKNQNGEGSDSLAEGEGRTSWRYFNTVNRVCSGVKKVRPHPQPSLLTLTWFVIDTRLAARPHPRSVVNAVSELHRREPRTGDRESADSRSDSAALDRRSDARLKAPPPSTSTSLDSRECEILLWYYSNVRATTKKSMIRLASPYLSNAPLPSFNPVVFPSSNLLIESSSGSQSVSASVPDVSIPRYVGIEK